MLNLDQVLSASSFSDSPFSELINCIASVLEFLATQKNHGNVVFGFFFAPIFDGQFAVEVEFFLSVYLRNNFTNELHIFKISY